MKSVHSATSSRKFAQPSRVCGVLMPRMAPATCVRSGDQTKVDSPGWEVRMKSLETGNDAALADSSPQGAALLARKVERQNQALDGALRRPPDTGELQRPTPPSRLAGGSR